MSTVLGSDSSVNNAERILRLPGLLNHKPPPAPCCVIEHDSTCAYALADFATLREPEVLEQPVQPPKPVARPLVGDQAVRAARYAATWERLPEGNGRNQSLYIHVKALVNDMCIPVDIARQTVIEWNQLNIPPLSDKELEQVIADALKYSNKNTPGCKNTGKSVKPVILKPASRSPSAGVWQDMEDSIAGRRKTIPWLIHEISDLTHCTLPGEVVIVVGQAGSAKSYWLLQEAANWFEQGHKTAILEAEKNIKYHLNRLAAQHSGYPGFVYPEWQQEHPELARSVKTDYEAFMDAFGQRMTDNGQNTLTINSVIEWARAQAESGCRIILIDPLTVVDRQIAQTWEADKHFVRSVQTICSNNNCTLIFVLHCTKERVEPALENVGGGAAFTQLADCVLWLKFHKKEDGELKTSYVRTHCGTAPDAIIHDRSVYVLKSRYEGTGSRIVCTFDKLRMESHGLAVAKPKG